MAQVKSIVFRYIMTYYNRQRIYTATPVVCRRPHIVRPPEAWPHKLQILGVHILHRS